jgi:NADH dehydrogenase [ubiquinone] 1 alpha subcomplex assembly factor 2
MRSDLSSRTRRIAQYPRATQYADVNHTPQFMQWLRHTREHPPTIEEQRAELSRQRGLVQLVARADARWKSVPSFLDKPKDTGQAQPLLQPRDNAGYGKGMTEGEEHQGVANAAKTEEEHIASLKGEDVDKGRFKGPTREVEPTRTTDPFKAAQRGNAGEGWQPAAWTPGKTTRRG